MQSGLRTMLQINGRCCHHHKNGNHPATITITTTTRIVIGSVCGRGGSWENCQLLIPGKHPTFFLFLPPSQVLGLKDTSKHLVGQFNVLPW